MGETHQIEAPSPLALAKHLRQAIRDFRATHPGYSAGIIVQATRILETLYRASDIGTSAAHRHPYHTEQYEQDFSGEDATE